MGFPDGGSLLSSPVMGALVDLASRMVGDAARAAEGFVGGRWTVRVRGYGNGGFMSNTARNRAVAVAGYLRDRISAELAAGGYVVGPDAFAVLPSTGGSRAHPAVEQLGYLGADRFRTVVVEIEHVAGVPVSGGRTGGPGDLARSDGYPAVEYDLVAGEEWRDRKSVV